MTTQLNLPSILALTTGQWTVVGLTAATIVAIIWVSRARARSAGAGEEATAAKVDAAPRSQGEVDAIEQEKQRRADLEERRAIERGPAPDLSSGPNLSKGPDLSDGPSLGR